MNYSMFIRGQFRNHTLDISEIREDYMDAASEAKLSNFDDWAAYMCYLVGA